MQRAVLLILAFGLALCLAIPSHRHHPIYEDLEEDVSGDEDQQDDDQLYDAEEDEQPFEVRSLTDEEARSEGGKDDLLAALDCGSSGTKLFLFAKSIEACPTKLESQMNCKDDYVKFKPTMSKLTEDLWSKALAPPAERVHKTTVGSYRDNIKYVKAFATAGNRIIGKDENTTAWQNLQAAFGKLKINFIGQTRTIPGTHEAFLEFKALNSGDLTNSKDFVSMGGASAQVGVVLDSTNKKDNWLAAIDHLKFDATTGLTPCNNQEKVEDFIAIVNGKASTFQASLDTSVCTSGALCVGLFSWVGTGELTNADGCKSQNSNSKKHHITAGNDSGQKIISLHTDTNSKCKSSSANAVDCAKQIEKVSGMDESTVALNTFFRTCASQGEGISVTLIATMKTAASVYLKFQEDAQSSAIDDKIKGSGQGSILFAFWAVHGILVPSGALVRPTTDTFVFDTVKSFDTASANWILYEAQQADFPRLCPIFMEPETYSDESVQATSQGFVQKGECVVLLEGTPI